MELLRTSGSTVSIWLNSLAPDCWVVVAAVAPGAVGVGVGTGVRVSAVREPPEARWAAVVWPVTSCVMRVATSCAVALRRKMTSVRVLGSLLASSVLMRLSKKGCWSAEPIRTTRLVRSSAVKLVPVLSRNGAPPEVVGVRRSAVSLFTTSVAIAALRS